MYKKIDYYKPNIDTVFSRMDKVAKDAIEKKNGNILFRVLTPSDIAIYSKIDVGSYNYDSDLNLYINDLSDAYAESFSERRNILDDAVPVISPILGIGDYSAFLAGDIYFSTDTSWSKPSLLKISDWQNLPEVGSNYWYKKFLEICAEMIKVSKGSGIPFSRGFFSPLDLAEALRGNNIYYDFTDSPDELHKLLNYCADATIQFAEDIFSIARKYLSDEKYAMWYIKGAINMSEDIACMISPELYREFGAPYTQKVIDHFGVGFMHTHSRAMYMVKEICSLKNVANLWLATDPNQPVPVKCLEQLIDDAQSTCLAIDCSSFEEFENTLDIARKGNVSYCLPVSDANEGQKLTQKANELLRIKGVIKDEIN